jgi:membrane protease subunit (stomatin/prohibitin family)
MTLRVWVTQLRSVVFGHQSHGSASRRIITGMLGLPGDADYLKNLVTQFAAAQSIVVAPTSTEDAKRMAAMGAMNQLGAAGGAQLALPQGAVAEILLQTAQPAQAVAPAVATQSSVPSTKAACFCSACGTKNGGDAAFCESCGAGLLRA